MAEEYYLQRDYLTDFDNSFFMTYLSWLKLTKCRKFHENRSSSYGEIRGYTSIWEPSHYLK